VTEKTDFNALIMVPKDSEEFDVWNNLNKLDDEDLDGVIKCYCATSNIYFVRPEFSGLKNKKELTEPEEGEERPFDAMLNKLPIDKERSLIILAKHFGNNAQPEEDLIESIRKINPNIVVLHYSLLIEGTDGYPAGIKKLYDKLSSPVENADELFKKLFELFRLEARKKKYENRVNQIADLQLLLSSYLLLESIGEKMNIESKKQNEIQSQIKAEAENFDKREAVTSINLKSIVENSFTSHACLELNQKLNNEKNKLIEEYAKLRKNAA